MKVRAHYRPGPGVLALRLRCKCVVILYGRRGSPPVSWPCRKCEAEDERPKWEKPKQSMMQLVKTLGGVDFVASLVAGARIGEIVRRRRIRRTS